MLVTPKPAKTLSAKVSLRLGAVLLAQFGLRPDDIAETTARMRSSLRERAVRRGQQLDKAGGGSDAGSPAAPSEAVTMALNFVPPTVRLRQPHARARARPPSSRADVGTLCSQLLELQRVG